MKTQTIVIDAYEITVNTLQGSGSIETKNIKADIEEEFLFNSAIDGLESLILSLACQGYDITEPKFKQAIDDAINGIAQNI